MGEPGCARGAAGGRGAAGARRRACMATRPKSTTKKMRIERTDESEMMAKPKQRRMARMEGKTASACSGRMERIALAKPETVESLIA